MGGLRLSGKERGRLEVLRKVSAGQVTRRKAAELLGVSYRQVLRLCARHSDEGASGLGHRLRGRKSNRGSAESRRERIVELCRAKYHDFGPTLAVEHLAQDDGETIGIETLRRWLVAAGLWEPRQRGARHRAWRERRECLGELVQMDGSNHDWFEGRHSRAVMMVMIDDATNMTWARLFEGETTEAAMTVFADYVGEHGLPRALYVDRASLYVTTRDATTDENLREKAPATQFSRAMEELGVKLMLANSPQAKGRVERRHAVFQDRFVKELRLRGIKTLEAANQYLRGEFLPDLDTRMRVKPKSNVDVHRKVPRGVRLDHVLCHREERLVQNDWTIAWRNRVLQIEARHQRLALARKKVEVSELLDGRLRLVWRGRELSWRELPERPRPVRATKPLPKAKLKRPHKPAANHPWRGKQPGG
jgi:transposase